MCSVCPLFYCTFSRNHVLFFHEDAHNSLVVHLNVVKVHTLYTCIIVMRSVSGHIYDVQVYYTTICVFVDTCTMYMCVYMCYTFPPRPRPILPDATQLLSPELVGHFVLPVTNIVNVYMYMYLCALFTTCTNNCMCVQWYTYM